MGETMKEAQQKARGKITTQILPADKFWEAEDYHQKYLLQQHPWVVPALDIDPGEDLINSHVAARLNGYIGGYGKSSMFDVEWEKLGINEKMAHYVRNQMIRNHSMSCCKWNCRNRSKMKNKIKSIRNK